MVSSFLNLQNIRLHSDSELGIGHQYSIQYQIRILNGKSIVLKKLSIICYR